MSISAAPANQNLLQASKFKLNFDRLPDTTFFCNMVNLPGLSLVEYKQPTALIDLYVPGNKLTYETLDITFMVDEELKSWKAVHDWIRGLTFPVNQQEYVDLRLQLKNPPLKKTNEKTEIIYSDASLSIFTNKNNPNYRVRFIECFPLNVSGIDFNAEADADTIISAKASFRFSYFQLDKV